MRHQHLLTCDDVQRSDAHAPKQLGIPGIGGRLPGALIVDLFAGGGGASIGIEMALGRSPDVAVNHDPVAIACHQRNHPATQHYQSDVFEVDPVRATHGQQVGLLWGSPDCTFHSRCLGAQPRSPRVRSLAWVMADWAKQVRPQTMLLENVPEFEDWGPLIQRLDTQGTPMVTKTGEPWMIPDPKHLGETFRAFVGSLRDYGYKVDWRTLNSCDYGAATSRQRLFLVARQGKAPAWPEPTHGPGRDRPYTPFSSCINWDHPARSIYGRNRPLADNTHARIARTIDQYLTGGQVVADRPATIVKFYGGVFGHGTDVPLGTITCVDHHGIAIPHLVTDRSPQVDRVAAYLTAHGAANPPIITTPAGPRYIDDIGFRMVQCDELARAQGFPDGYALPRTIEAAQLLIGNSVVPLMSRAMVAANVEMAPRAPRSLEAA